MVNFVIAGKPDCKNFVQVLNVACYLQKNLPSFEYTKIELTDYEWADYLIKTNREHQWHHGESPLIYKELYTYGSKKPNLIGGISEFWEYCYDYYGIEVALTEDEVEALRSHNLESFNKNISGTIKNKLKIMIYGATNNMTSLLLPEFMKIEECRYPEELQFFLYDEKLETSNQTYFDNFNEEFTDLYGTKAIYCDSLAVGLKDCDYLIMLDDTLEIFDDSEELQNYFLQICFLCEEINSCANRNMKIIFANNGYSCLIATIVARKVRIPHSQIVVVSSDRGLGYLGEMSRRLNIDTRKMSAPPVWGSLGFNDFVDAGSTLLKCKVYKPNARAVHAHKDSTLTHGTIRCELRYINYLSDNIKDLAETVNRRREIVRHTLQRPAMLAKLEALLSLLKIWLDCSTIKDPIISLGIMSDGSFNIPPKIVFSQPAIRFKNGWIPYSSYPVPKHILESVMAAGIDAETHYESYIGGKTFKEVQKRLTYEYFNDEMPNFPDLSIEDFGQYLESITTL